MKKENLANLSEEIRKIQYRVNYRINETPRYRPLVGNNEEFDEVPALTNEAGEDEGIPSPEKPPVTDQPAGTQTPTPVPAFDQVGGGEEMPNPEGTETPEPPMDGNIPTPESPMGDAPVEPQNQVNDIQNEIIKHNIEAMKSIHDQLEGLNNVVQGLNNKLNTLNADVEEVREPTNSEKLMNKSKVSYPYYFNLNDFWSGNWFNEKRDKEMEKGIKELPDGTFVADFDDLPQKSKIDIKNSFNQMQESIVKKKSNLKEDFNLPNNSGGQSEIDGSANKKTAINRIYAKVSPLTKGFFSDTGWKNIQKVFDMFNTMNLDWNITKSEYDGSMPPERKTWHFEINYVDNVGKTKEIGGYLVASGAGSVEDPLDKYDMIFVLY